MPYAAGLYYELHGSEDAPSLILSSGLGGSASYWKPNIAALAEHFRVIAYDHRGTGRSDRALPNVVTVDDFADDILALMNALGVERVGIIGHAAGAEVRARGREAFLRRVPSCSRAPVVADPSLRPARTRRAVVHRRASGI